MVAFGEDLPSFYSNLVTFLVYFGAFWTNLGTINNEIQIDFLPRVTSFFELKFGLLCGNCSASMALRKALVEALALDICSALIVKM